MAVPANVSGGVEFQCFDVEFQCFDVDYLSQCLPRTEEAEVSEGECKPAAVPAAASVDMTSSKSSKSSKSLSAMFFARGHILAASWSLRDCIFFIS